MPPDPLAPTLIWSDALLLGYTPMDEVHEAFVALVGRMADAPADERGGLLAALVAHAEAHFGLEDRWMRETAFPARDCHLDEHAAVLASLRAVAAQVAAGDHGQYLPLVQELVRWFPGHADYLDSALAAWMCKRQLGARPVVLRRHLRHDGPLPPSVAAVVDVPAGAEPPRVVHPSPGTGF